MFDISAYNGFVCLKSLYFGASFNKTPVNENDGDVHISISMILS